MSENTNQKSRRGFLVDTARTATIIAGGSMAGFLAGKQGKAKETRWQIDPDKCVACGNCATHCILDESAVKCFQAYDMCGYCDLCTGYVEPEYSNIDTAAENQLCPTDAVVRTFVDKKAGQSFYEYHIDEVACIGCAKCVQGCALMNGSLYLQVMHDRCVNCNECAIAISCPVDAYTNIPKETPYLMKNLAVELLHQKVNDKGDKEAQELLDSVYNAS